MNPQEIMEQIKKAQRELTILNNKLFQYGQEKEYAEQKYRIELSKKLSYMTKGQKEYGSN